MPYANNDGVAVHYEVGGDGATDETVVLLADAGYGAWQWSWQYPALAGPFEVVVVNARGTGDSDRPDSGASGADNSDASPSSAAHPSDSGAAAAGASGTDAPADYDVATMADDLEAVLADHGVRKAHLVGAGLGGMIALRYAREYSRAATLSLLGTSPAGRGAEPTPSEIRERLAVDPADPKAVRESLEPVAGEDLLASDELVDRIATWRRAEDADREVARAHRDAMAAFDASDWLYEVTVPALVLHGENDRVIPAENGRLLAEGLPKGEFRAFPGEHFFFVEQSKAVNDALIGFLEEHGEA